MPSLRTAEALCGSSIPRLRAPPAFRAVPMPMVAAGIGVMIADNGRGSSVEWSRSSKPVMDRCASLGEYSLRFAVAPAVRSRAERRMGDRELEWASSMGGLCDLLGTLTARSRLCYGPRWSGALSVLLGFSSGSHAPGLAAAARDQRGKERPAVGYPRLMMFPGSLPASPI